MCLVDPKLENGAEIGLTKSRAKRPLKTYKNPHKGEQVKTKGGNQKTLIAVICNSVIQIAAFKQRALFIALNFLQFSRVE